jgi:tol-pal system protein YbgF
MWIRNAQIVILTVCVVVFGSLIVTSTASAQSADTFNRNADSDSIIDDSVSNPDRQVFDGYDAPKKKIVSEDATSSSPASMSPSYQSLLEQRISNMERQIRELTGKIEQLSFENSQLKTNLEKSQTDIDARLNEIKGAPKPAVADTVTPTVDTSATTPTSDTDSSTLSPDDTKDLDGAASADSPTQQKLGTITKAPNGTPITPDKSQDAASMYEEAYADLKAGNAASAQGKFESFLKKFPEHPLRANAVYWMGETFYAQAKYDQATRVFAESYKKYPKGPKAADSLLKMGMSLGQNGKTKEACVTFKQLKKEYAVGQTAILRRADAEMAKLACK